MGEELNRLNKQWKKHGQAPVAMRNGIHTGAIVAGKVGSDLRMKYTTVGSNVNLAARLEAMHELPAPNPEMENQNCRILVSADTASLLGNEFQMSSQGQFKLRGISREVDIFLIKQSVNDMLNKEITDE